MTYRTTITRKEITDLFPTVTYDWIRRHERQVGLYACRVKHFHRPILYQRAAVLLVFVNIGLLSADDCQNCAPLPNRHT